MNLVEHAELWQRYQDWLYFHAGLRFFVDISRIQFGSDWLTSMEPRFTQAFAEMRALEAGAIANPDEQRQVGHYWLRSPELAPTPDLTAAIQSTLTQIEHFATQIHHGSLTPPTAGRFTDLIWIGIGGSALGPQFVSAALAPDQPPIEIHFIDNTDPDGMDRVLAQLRSKLGSTLVAVTSKSGGTPEPRNGMIEMQAAYQAAGLSFPNYAVAITGEGSRLDRQAQAEAWIQRFPIFDWVGGRTSEFSAVGLLPAALQGIDIRSVLAGAAEMDEVTRCRDLRQNPAALLALAWYAVGEGRGKKDMVVLPYKDRLALLSRYLQQLVMESLGKSHDLDGHWVEQGIAVYGNKGSTDQHAYVQQLRDGVHNFFVTFIEVLQDRSGSSLELEPWVTSGDYLHGFLQGTRQALFENQRQSITVTIPQVDPRSVGALIALYERAVGFYASLIRINAYHQPGVEAGKKAAGAVLDLQRKVITVLNKETKPLSLADLAAAIQAPDHIEILYTIVRHLDANQRYVRIVEGNLGQPETLRIQARS